jgi:hypothetical protein
MGVGIVPQEDDDLLPARGLELAAQSRKDRLSRSGGRTRIADEIQGGDNIFSSD